MLDETAYAAILDGLGKHKESELIYRRVFGVFENAFGPRHYETATVLHSLAAVLAARGCDHEAEEHYRYALTTLDQLLGSDSPEVALIRNNLGALLKRMRRFAEAIPLLEKAVAVFGARLERGHPHLVRAHENLQEALRGAAGVTRHGCGDKEVVPAVFH